MSWMFTASLRFCGVGLHRVPDTEGDIVYGYVNENVNEGDSELSSMLKTTNKKCQTEVRT